MLPANLQMLHIASVVEEKVDTFETEPATKAEWDRYSSATGEHRPQHSVQ